MRAIVFDEPGDEDVLRLADVAPPDLREGEVRIAIAGAGINRADLLQRRGLYPPPPGASEIIGLECAGTLTEIGVGVDDLAVGDRVMALLSGGGYATETVAPSVCVMRTPQSLADLEAAGVPEVFITAFLNLFLIGDLEPNSTALVHGGSGGVGTAAIQLAKSAGARVFVTAGSEDRCRACLELGADAAFNHRQEDFLAATLDATDGHGVEVVLDCIGGAYLDRHLDVMAPYGRLMVIGLQGGAQAEIDLSRLMRKRLTVTGSTLRARPIEEKGRIIEAFVRRFGPELVTGAIRPIVDRVLPLEKVSEAHRLLAAGEIFGKLVLEMPSG
ncbi:MAG: NAD(P)H-quinone oxidoreductase [Thermoanaerobaculales bacterium]|nr:NAD(P)H-quinone oxidoreductase [Thermoanaerobaculales bacterium]